jgi:hypothetical protein
MPGLPLVCAVFEFFEGLEGKIIHIVERIQIDGRLFRFN